MKRTRLCRTAPRRSSRTRGFTLIEALAALTIAGVVVASAIGTVGVAMKTQREQRHAWLAFSIAQSKMEELGAVEPDDPLLVDDEADLITDPQIGSTVDAQCTTGADSSLTADMKVDDLGNASAAGQYTLCWKVTNDHPAAGLKAIRVVVEYPSQGGTKSVLLQLIR